VRLSFASSYWFYEAPVKPKDAPNSSLDMSPSLQPCSFQISEGRTEIIADGST
jgi:hypothetical protein